MGKFYIGLEDNCIKIKIHIQLQLDFKSQNKGMKMIKSKFFRKSLVAVSCSALLLGAPSILSANTETASAIQAYNAVSDRAVDKKQLEEFIKIFGGLKDSALKLDIPAIKDLGGLFDTITGIATSVATGKPDFDIQTVAQRIELAINIVKTIVDVTNPESSNFLYYKEQRVLTEFGFQMTGIILNIINPLTKSGTLDNDKARLIRIVAKAAAGANMTDSSVANTNVKEELETLLRENRNFAYITLFPIKNNDVVEDYKKYLLSATGIRLNPMATWKEVKEAKKTLEAKKAAAQVAFDNADPSQILAPTTLRIEFDKKLHKARFLKFNELKGKDADALRKLDDEILRLTGVRLNPMATVADLKKAENDLEVAIDIAKNSEAKKVSKESRETLLKELHEARFMKFNVLSKKGWDVNSKLDGVIASLSWTSINAFASADEISNAVLKLREAVKAAKAAPNLW